MAEDNDNTWTMVNKTGDGIEIYSRSIAGTNIREYRASLTVNSTPAAVYQSAVHKETYDNISKYLEINRIIYTENPALWYNYQRINPPIISKRDYTLKYETTADKETGNYIIWWVIANDHGPAAEPSVVRVETCRGKISITPAGNGSSLISYELITDPGGYIPAWAVNIANRTSLPDILRAIRDHIKER
jgi:hypothetical protein